MEQEKIVITITEDASKDTSQPATRAIPSENGEKIICVKTIQDSRENCTLSNSVFNGENVRKRPIPSYIGKLIHVDEEQESHKDDSRRGNSGVSWYPRYQKIFGLTENFD